jgi:MFS family permease
MGFAMAGYAMFAPLVPLYAVRLGASPALVGFLVSLAFLPSLFLAIPLGAASDQLGPIRVLRSGGVLLAGAPLIMVVHPALATLVVFQVAAGLAQLMLVVSAQARVADLSPDRLRERNYGWYTTALSAGQAVGPLAAGTMLDLAGFRSAYLLASLVAAAAVIAFALMLNGALRARGGSASPASMLRRLPSMVGNRGVRIAMIASTAVLMGVVGVQAFLPVRLEAMAISGTTIGLLFSAKALAAVVVRPFVAHVSRLFGRRWRALVTVVFVVAAALLVPSIHESVAGYLIMAILVGVGSGVSQPLSMAMVIDHVHARERGLALGLRLSGNRAAQFLSPTILGIVATVADVRAVFPVAAAIMIGLNLLVVRWSLGPREADAGSTVSR